MQRSRCSRQDLGMALAFVNDLFFLPHEVKKSFSCGD